MRIEDDQPLVERLISRRGLLSAAARTATLLMSSKNSLAKAQSERAILIPMPAEPWAHTNEIVGKGADTGIFYNDFCLTQDRTGRWHCIGIIGGSGIEPGQLFHVVSDQLQGPYASRPNITINSNSRSQIEMWAPTIVWAGQEKALMLYAHGVHAAHGDEIEFQMRVLESDKYLDEWKPPNVSTLEDGNVLFKEKDCRDPEVDWIEERQTYFLYYVSGAGTADPSNPNEVRVRESRDLLHWGKPKTVMLTPPGYQAAESVFVLKRNGLYYLWVSGFDYGRMSLYISEDPTNFGDPVKNRIMEQSGHAPEIVQSRGHDWMACVRVASKFGNAPAEADLTGVYLQPLRWTRADAAALARINRK